MGNIYYYKPKIMVFGYINKPKFGLPVLAFLGSAPKKLIREVIVYARWLINLFQISEIWYIWSCILERFGVISDDGIYDLRFVSQNTDMTILLEGSRFVPFRIILGGLSVQIGHWHPFRIVDFKLYLAHRVNLTLLCFRGGYPLGSGLCFNSVIDIQVGRE